MRVELGRLGTLWPVAEDRRGTVFTTASVRVGTGLPAVYKQYNEHFLTVTTVRHLEALVARLAGSEPPGVAHPTALVVSKGGLITGYLMREAPPGLVPPDTLLSGDAPVPPIDELRTELTSLVDLLHAAALTLGDRPIERLLIDPSDRPRCFLNAGDELEVHAPAEGAEPDGMQRIAMAADRAFVEDLLTRLDAVPAPVVVAVEPAADEPVADEPVGPGSDPVAALSPPPPPSKRRWPVLAAVALLVAIGLLLGVGLSGGTTIRKTAGRGTVIPAFSAPAPSTPSVPPSPSPSPAGLVDTTAVSTDPRAPAIGAMFETYFSAINNRDTERAVSVFDQARTIDPKDFAHGVSTSRDTDVHVLTITGDTPVTARVTLRSDQSPGFGPNDRPNETCTRWDITYDLSHPADPTYLILRTHHTTSTPC